MATRVYRWRHLTLLVSILFIIISGPLVAPLRHGVMILNVIGATVLGELQPKAFAAATEVLRNDYVGRSTFAGRASDGNFGAILGQFYLVALIARLVGLHIVHGTGSNSPVKNEQAD